MGDDSELSSESDEDEDDDDSDDDSDELEASQSLKKPASKLEESRASNSRSRDDLAQASVSMKSTKKMAKWVEPEMPAELQYCDKLDR